jgi:hypothetical protein
MFYSGPKPAPLSMGAVGQEILPPHPLGLSTMSAIRQGAHGRHTSNSATAGRARLARRLQIESGILWSVFGVLSATYVGLFGHVLGVW